MLSGQNKNVSQLRRNALLGAAPVEPKIEEKKDSPEISQEERKHRAI